VSAFPQLAPRYNIAPTQLVICVRPLITDPLMREAVLLKWGLIPFWAKDASIGSRMINARSETVAEKPAFRKAFQARRCIIPADGFYEWQKLSDGTRQPWFIHQPDDTPFGFAGLWESWKPKDGEEIQSCTILTTDANADLRELHDRMPVVLPPDQQVAWLSQSASRGQLQAMMQPRPEGTLVRHPVAPLVNSVRNDNPACVDSVKIESRKDASPSSVDRQQTLFD